MKYTGQAVDILCRMNPKYNKFVVIENGIKVLYVRMVMAIYGCIQSGLLWYRPFSFALHCTVHPLVEVDSIHYYYR